MASRASVGVCVVVVVVVMWTMMPMVCAKTRTYYVGIVEREWDYAPGGEDLLAFHSSQAYSPFNQDSHSGLYLDPGPYRIGRKYMKAMYREFTDGTFTYEKPREEWMGLLGPVLGGDEGDTVVVVFRNMALISGRHFSMHPHGLKYTKANEGALYQDGTKGAQKLDESVGPGQQYTYTWEVTPEVSPTQDDPDCVTWTYHSHVNTVRDVNSGLVGILLTCKPGAMDSMKLKYARQFAMVVNIFDENQSWYIDYNIRTHLPALSIQEAQALKEDADFQKSNRMDGYNGLMYGHLKGLDVCLGSRTLWHVIGFGNEIDVHSLSVSGHSFLVNQHRMDALLLNPVQTVTAELEAQTVGEWRVQCSVLNYAQDGMVASLNVKDCGYYPYSFFSQVQQFKHYYIAIVEVDWDYAPSGRNLFDDEDLLQPGSFSEKYFNKTPGGVYRKAVFRQYQDVTFSQETERGAEEEHLGFLGPVLRVETGDLVALTLKNNAKNQAFSLQPHGARVLKMWEGALYNDHTGYADHQDDVVVPGQVKTNYWFFPEAMGPGPMDPPCITRLYTSSSRDIARDAYSGLTGPLLICRKGALDKYGRQHQVDREFFLLLSVTDENLSWYSDYNLGLLQASGGTPAGDFYQSHLMHSINGYVYGNLPGLSMCLGDRVAWHLFSVGSEHDLHTVYFHGQPLTLLDTRQSSTQVLPGYFRTLLMKAENPGIWALVDQTDEHYNAGSKALFTVSQCDVLRDYSINPTHGNHTTYFLQAEEELWDYAPTGMDKISGMSLDNVDGDAFTRNDGPYIGSKYKKVRYHQYTDVTFTKKVDRLDSELYLGVLGPVIMAEAFDLITVVFRNMASRPYSVHAQGLFYTKTSEGSSYAGHFGEVGPDQTVVYEWSVPLDFAPAEGDPACINRAYYSAVDPVKDIDSGLIGPLVICKPGTLDRASRKRMDVDRFFVVLFKNFDEGQSWYLQDNIQMFGGPKDSLQDPMFQESNLMHSINGYVYGNGPPMEMTQMEGVAWHLMTLGTQKDLHSVHWHGNQVLQYSSGRHTRDVVQLFPGVFQTVRMNATHVGTWLMHCHVHDHMTAGMETVYVVKSPAPADPFGEGAVSNK